MWKIWDQLIVVLRILWSKLLYQLVLGKKIFDINIMELEIQIYVQKSVWINVDNLGTIKDIVEGDWVK